jgi:integrase
LAAPWIVLAKGSRKDVRNHEFVDLPIIDPTKQHRPTVTKTELEQTLAAINPRFRVLVAMLAGTGLRIGEALGVKTVGASFNLVGLFGVTNVERMNAARVA